MKNLNDFIVFMNIPPSTRISGRHFAALASLTFGTDMPSWAVLAGVKRIAASEKVVDNVASSIGVQDILKFGTKYKEAFLEAGQLMRSSEALLPDIDPQARAISSGWLQMSLIDHTSLRGPIRRA